MRALALALRTLLREWTLRRARRAGARDHGGGGGAHGRGLSRRSHRHRGRQPGGRSARGRPAPGIRRSRWTTRPSTEAQRRGLEIARNTGLFSVVFNGDVNQLTSLRAVSDEISAARQGDALRRALRRAGAGARHSGARRGLAGFAPRGGAGRERRHAAQHRRQHISASSRILISRPDQGATFLELAPSLHHERGGPRGDAAHAARQPRAACAAVRRAARRDRRVQGLARRRTRSRTRKSRTSKTRRRRSSRPSIARRAS